MRNKEQYVSRLQETKLWPQHATAAHGICRSDQLGHCLQEIFFEADSDGNGVGHQNLYRETFRKSCSKLSTPGTLQVVGLMFQDHSRSLF